MRVAVVGAGSWGTAVANLCSVNADVVLWAREPRLAACIDTTHENPTYLPGLVLPRLRPCDLRPRSRLHRCRRRRDGRPVARLPDGADAGRSEHRCGRARHQPREGSRAGHAGADDPGRRRGAPGARLGADRRADRPEPGPRGRRRAADGVGRRGDRRGDRQPAAAAVHDADVPRLHEHRRRGVRDRGRAQERDRHRGGRSGRARLRRQHPCGPDHARPCGARAPGRRPRG